MTFKETVKKIFNSLKKATLSVIHGIFCEKKLEGGYKFSLGRILLLIVFTVAVIMWVGVMEIPSTMLTVLLVLIGYNLGSKALTAIEMIKKDPKTGERSKRYNHRRI